MLQKVIFDQKFKMGKIFKICLFVSLHHLNKTLELVLEKFKWTCLFFPFKMIQKHSWNVALEPECFQKQKHFYLQTEVG